MSALPRSLLAEVIGKANSWAYRRKEGMIKNLHVDGYVTELLCEAGAWWILFLRVCIFTCQPCGVSFLWDAMLLLLCLQRISLDDVCIVAIIHQEMKCLQLKWVSERYLSLLASVSRTRVYTACKFSHPLPTSLVLSRRINAGHRWLSYLAWRAPHLIDHVLEYSGLLHVQSIWAWKGQITIDKRFYIIEREKEYYKIQSYRARYRYSSDF